MAFTAAAPIGFSNTTHGFDALREFYTVMDEKRADKAKEEAQEFKALQSLVKTRGWADPNEFLTRDLGSARGFVRAKFAEEANQVKQDEIGLDAIKSAIAGRKLNQEIGAARDFAGFQQGWQEQMGQQPANDPMAALASLSAQYPQAAGAQGYGEFRQMMDLLTPAAAKTYAPDDLAKNQERRAELERQGKTGSREWQEINARIAKINDPSGEDMVVYDREGNPILTKGNPKISGGAATHFQKKLAAYDQAISGIADVERVLDESMVGIRGYIGEKVIDKLVGQFAPDAVNEKRVDGRVKLKAAVQGMVRLINTDERFSNEDRKKAEEVTSNAGWNESLKSSLATLGTLKEIFARNSIIVAEHAGADRPMSSLSPTEIRDKIAKREMSIEEGLRLLDLYHPKFVP